MNKVKFLTILSMAALALLVAGCSSDDNNTVPSGGTIPSAQAGQALSMTIPATIDLTVGVSTVLANLPDPQPPRRGQVEPCLPITDGKISLCTVPTAGLVCDTGSGTSLELRFENCVIADSMEGDTLNGVIFAAPSGTSSAALNFQLTLNGDVVGGQMSVDYGSRCIQTVYNSLTLSVDGVASTLNGLLEICSATDANGDYTMSISAAPFAPFVTVVMQSGNQITATVDDDGMPPPLYTCTGTYNGDSTSVTCN